MTFPSILPHLQAGRRVRRAYWLPGQVMGGGNERLTEVADLLATDWELVEEPTRLTQRLCPTCGGVVTAAAIVEYSELPPRLCDCPAQLHDALSTISRLTRERDTELRACGELGAENQRLTRELASSQRSFHALRDGLRGVLDAASEKS